jgi:hypothetical protein
MTVAQEQQQDLPWWTEEEMQKVAAIDDFVRATSNYYDVPGTINESPIKYNSYKADVLDKYRSNPYSDMGYDEIVSRIISAFYLLITLNLQNQ